MAELIPGPGRPTKLLDDDIRETLLQAISNGTTFQAAAAAAGIGERTLYSWIERGRRADHDLTEHGEIPVGEEPFLHFLHALTRAHARGQVHNAELLRRVADGGYVIKTRTRRYRDAATGQVVEETETDLAPPDLRAIIFYLERRHPAAWGKGAEQVELSGPGGGPVEVAQEGMEQFVALAARVRQAREQLGMTAGDGPESSEDHG